MQIFYTVMSEQTKSLIIFITQQEKLLYKEIMKRASAIDRQTQIKMKQSAFDSFIKPLVVDVSFSIPKNIKVFLFLQKQVL